MLRHQRPGFTVIELIVVIVIMAVLTSVTLISLAGQQSISRNNERKTDAENIARGLERYYKVNGQYPDISQAATIASTSLLPDVAVDTYHYSFNNDLLAFAVTNLSGTTTVTDASADAQATTTTIVYLPMVYTTQWEPCDSSQVCTRFVIAYGTEDSSTKTHIKSRSQQ